MFMDLAQCYTNCSQVIRRLPEGPATRLSGYCWTPNRGNRALLNPKISRDLSTICLKCLEKDPKRRYSSALALAEDLERWLKHEPIQARHAGVFTRGRKWVQRNPTSALLAAALVAFAAAVGWNHLEKRTNPWSDNNRNRGAAV